MFWGHGPAEQCRTFVHEAFLSTEWVIMVFFFFANTGISCADIMSDCAVLCREKPPRFGNRAAHSVPNV